MYFIIKNISNENIQNLMRKIGYHFQNKNEEKSEMSFIRPINRNDYPRFHIYLKINIENNELNFNLHLDQKKPIYKNTTAHSGEYEGKIIEDEIKRIKEII